MHVHELTGEGTRVMRACGNNVIAAHAVNNESCLSCNVFECPLSTAVLFVCPSSYVRKDIDSGTGRTKKNFEERKSTTPTRSGVGKWAQEPPGELWQLALGNLSAVDRLSCVTSTR